MRQAIIWSNADLLLMNFEQKFDPFHERKCIWKRRLRNDGHFVSASMCLRLIFADVVCIRVHIHQQAQWRVFKVRYFLWGFFLISGDSYKSFWLDDTIHNGRWHFEKSRGNPSVNKIHDTRVGEMCDVHSPKAENQQVQGINSFLPGPR